MGDTAGGEARKIHFPGDLLRRHHLYVAILGQSRSTIDLRAVILDGGIVLVSTAQGTVGRDVSALVGASLLNLVDSVIPEQERLPMAQRRGALVVVDEKFGASFVLATQSLDKLEDLSRTMPSTLLANVGCLAVFQVAGTDARTLMVEMSGYPRRTSPP